MVDAAASVRPARSSITCAVMCLLDRNTARRGRSAVPADLLAHPAVTADAGFALLLALNRSCVPYFPDFPALRTTCSPT